jgi:hypothetical protein
MGNKTDMDQTSSRRGFLKMVGVSAPAAIAAVTASGGTAEASTDDQTSSGLQDTAHTRAYLDSARF